MAIESTLNLIIQAMNTNTIGKTSNSHLNPWEINYKVL
jgi:hypothetical protein